MPQNEFTIGTVGASFKESKIFIGIITIFSLLFYYSETIITKLELNYNYKFYFLAIFIFFLIFSIIYGILKQKDIKTKLIINENNILVRTYRKELVLDEKILNKNSNFNVQTIDHVTNKNLTPSNITTYIFISDEINKLKYKINSSDIPLINKALLSIQNQGLKNLEQIIKNDKIIRTEGKFLMKIMVIGIFFIIIIGALSIILALKYINK